MANPGRRKRSIEKQSMLLEKADVQGYLTTEDLMEVYPDVSQDVDRFQIIISALRRRGVDILDREADSVYKEDELVGDVESLPMVSVESVSSDDTIGLYLKEMSRVPLLSSAEETELAQRIERGRYAYSALRRLNGRASAARRRELNQQVEDGQLAREHLIKANTRLVVSIAKRYIGRGVPFLDLIQEGNLGLMKAV